MTKRSKIVKEPYFTLITLGIKSEDLLNRRSGGGGNLLYISHFNLHPSLLHPQWTKSLSLRLISSSPLYSSPSPRRRLPPMIPTVIISPLTAGPSSTSLSPLHLRILLRPTRVPTHPIELTSPPAELPSPQTQPDRPNHDPCSFRPLDRNNTYYLPYGIH